MHSHLLRGSIRLLALSLCSLVLWAASPTQSWAQESVTKPINLALFAPIQIVPEGHSVKGFRFSLLYGKNHNVEGLDLSLVGIANDFKGVQVALAGINNGNFTGLQWAGVGVVKKQMTGVQFNFVNVAESMKWVQAGAVNYTETAEGLQISFVNWTETLHGLQIGLLNFAKNGFLPIFPFFNFNFDK